jgi:hypothetical protein
MTPLTYWWLCFLTITVLTGRVSYDDNWFKIASFAIGGFGSLACMLVATVSRYSVIKRENAP